MYHDNLLFCFQENDNHRIRKDKKTMIVHIHGQSINSLLVALWSVADILFGLWVMSPHLDLMLFLILVIFINIGTVVLMPFLSWLAFLIFSFVLNHLLVPFPLPFFVFFLLLLIILFFKLLITWHSVPFNIFPHLVKNLGFILLRLTQSRWWHSTW